MNSSSPSRLPSATRSLPALAAVAVVGTVVIAGVAAGGFGDDGGGDPQSASTSATTLTSTTVPVTAPIVVESTDAPTTHLSQPLGMGMAGEEVRQVQERLDELGFFVGEIDGQFGPLFQQAMWAYQKLVLNVPRDEVDSILTDELWQDMQRGIRVEPMRWHSKGDSTENHVEIYLPSQVAVFFVDDKAEMIVHISSGDGKEWKEVVKIDPGEFGNENGTEVLERREIGLSVTPGGVFKFERIVEGLRNSALGGMWDPAYFNFGIAMHGALNVPLHPASHGCIRMSQTAGRTFHQYIDIGDQVFVWDGIKEPEYYSQNPNGAYPNGPIPIFNRIDHTYTTTTTSTTVPSTTVAPTVAPQATPAPTSPPTVAQTPAPTQPPTTPPPPVTTSTTTTSSTTVAVAPAAGG